MKISLKTLSNLNGFRKTRTLCDVTLISNDGCEFHAHKSVLAACSLYFQKYFDQKFLERNDDYDDISIEFEEFDEIVISTTLNCFYGESEALDEKKIPFESTLQLLSFADFLISDQLLDFCQSLMLHFLSTKNSFRILLVSERYSLMNVWRQCRIFILQNFHRILEFEFQQFLTDVNDAQLLVDILDDGLLNVRDEYDVFLCVKGWIEFDFENRKKFLKKLARCIRYELIKEHREWSNVLAFCQTANVALLDYFVTCVLRNSSKKRYRIPSDLIFVFCGIVEGDPVNVIEVYDNKSEKFSVWNTENCLPRMYYGMAEVDGKIYLVGGYVDSDYCNGVSCFNSATKSFCVLSSMIVSRCYVAVAALNGFIYACGGFDGRFRLASVEKYDIQANQWSFVCPMNSIRNDASAASMNGFLYVAGGCNLESGCLRIEQNRKHHLIVNFILRSIPLWVLLSCLLRGAQAERESRPKGQSREADASGNWKRCYSHDTLLKNLNIMLSELEFDESVERYDPKANCWQTIAPMIEPRSGLSLECVDDRYLFAIGGYPGGDERTEIEKYDRCWNHWEQVADMSVKRSNIATAVMDRYIYCIGGYDGCYSLDVVERYDIDANEWHFLEPLNGKRSALKACVIKSLPNARDFILRNDTSATATTKLNNS